MNKNFIRFISDRRVFAIALTMCASTLLSWGGMTRVMAGQTGGDARRTELLVEEPMEVPLAEASVARLAEQARRMVGRREFEAGLDAVNQGISIKPSYIPLWLLKARAHIALNQNEEAEEALAVCLLKDPDDVDANLYQLINTMVRTDTTPAEKVRFFTSRLDTIGEDVFSDILIRFSWREDFPEYLSALLVGWRKTNSPLDLIRNTLALYSGGHVEDARALLRKGSATGINPALLDAIHDLLDDAVTEDGVKMWAVDRGVLTRNGQDMVLTTQPESQAFAWLRMSPGWRNASAAIRLDGEPDDSRSLYLRYTSPDSYVRLFTEQDRMVIQERVPEYGLSTIFEYPKSALGSQLLRLLLKNDRLDFMADGKSLLPEPLPISPTIREGKAAVGSENVGSADFDAVFSQLDISRIDSNWATMTGGNRDDLRRQLGEEITATIVPVGDKNLDGTNIPAFLLMASGAGVSTFAGLREGSLNFAEMRDAVKGLPPVMADRIWTGVIITPNRNTNWRDIASAVNDAAERGLETALLLNAATARGLAGQKLDFCADFILLEDAELLNSTVMGDLANYYIEALYHVPGASGRYASIVQ